MIYPKLSIGSILRKAPITARRSPAKSRSFTTFYMKDLMFVLSPLRCVSSTLSLSFWRKGAAQHGKIINPASLPHFLPGAPHHKTGSHGPQTPELNRASGSFFLFFFHYFDTFLIPLSHIFISGRRILAISVLQSGQEIELHAQFALHYLARHYPALWRTVLTISERH